MKGLFWGSVCALLLVATSTFAAANDFIFLNNLSRELSFKIYSKDNTHCSAELGVLQPDSYNKITESAIRKACPFFNDTCLAYVFLSHDCSGEVIAFVKFSGYSGIESIVRHETRQGMPEIQYGKNFMLVRGFE